ncbi:glycosyltransferase [Rhodococcus sp. BH5]|uniref:glycosyltransferase n=1 Tax=Rhodococcus sp. BH5 TaxID=2871702 RepID=UPI0022CD3D06|nr:glycosyltransferase [Rhodococcus sp. BH5]MCZ9634720.1 glycosyltransferase [Rhodococcus sp. BH5]
MKVIVGTYRKQQYIHNCITSLKQHVTGTTELVFIDDSGDTQHHQWLKQTYNSKVIDTGRQGYGAAMQAACAEGATEDYALWLEEDFTFTKHVDLDEYAQHLDDHPYLAQVVFLRQPWFQNEVAAGGLIEALEVNGHEFTLVDGLLEQSATFSGNPSVWRRDVFVDGWPVGDWSEDAKRDRLLGRGFRFAFTPDVVVHHWGVRSGFGY